jgi:hypothetical protein
MESVETIATGVSKLHLLAMALTILAVASTIALLAVAAIAFAPTHIDPVAFEFPTGALVFVLQPVVCPSALLVAALNRRFNPSRMANRSVLACALSAAVWLVAFLWLL